MQPAAPREPEPTACGTGTRGEWEVGQEDSEDGTRQRQRRRAAPRKVELARMMTAAEMLGQAGREPGRLAPDGVCPGHVRHPSRNTARGRSWRSSGSGDRRTATVQFFNAPRRSSMSSAQRTSAVITDERLMTEAIPKWRSSRPSAISAAVWQALGLVLPVDDADPVGRSGLAAGPAAADRRLHGRQSLVHSSDGRLGRQPRWLAVGADASPLAELRPERRQTDLGRRGGGGPTGRPGQSASDAGHSPRTARGLAALLRRTPRRPPRAVRPARTICWWGCN